MMILFFVRRFYPLIGGVETHVLEISKRLVAKGHKVVIVTEALDSRRRGNDENKVNEFSNTDNRPHPSPLLQGEGESEKEIVQGVSVYRITVGGEDWFKKFRIWKEIWKLRSVIQKADIIHCHDVFFWYLPFRFLFFNKPVYTTFHGYETTFPPTKKAIFIRKLSEKLSKGNICVGDFIKKWYGTQTTYVTYGAVNKNVLKPHPNPFLQREGKFLKIAFLGRLEADTGLKVYIKALQSLREQKILFTFDAYGDGSLKNQIKKYGTVHGFISNVTEKMQQADIIFASSYLSILQAMIQKRLVVAVYDNPLKEDYLKMAPFAKWIVIADNAEEIAERVAFTVKKNKRTQSMIEKGYAWAKEQTWETLTNVYLALWN